MQQGRTGWCGPAALAEQDKKKKEVCANFICTLIVARFAANGKRPAANDPETGVNRAVHKKFTFPLDKQRTDFYNSTVG